MNCQNYSDLINDLVEKKLDEQTSQTVFLHIASCPNCENQFEIQFNENDICSNFFSEIKPINNLSNDFRTKLRIVNEKKSNSFIEFNWLKNFFETLRFKPALAGLVILSAFGLVYFWFNTSISNNEETIASEITKPIVTKTVNTDAEEVNQNDKQLEIAKSNESKPKSAVDPKQVLTVKKPKTEIVATKISSAKKPTIPTNISDKEIQFKEIQSFKADTEKQLGKMEMLLRSFRNARNLEGSDAFDIDYETEQARKLIEKNAKLRKIAQKYRIFDIEEVLSSSESLLIEIAKLNRNSPREQVIEIKRRVYSENAIANLQVY